MKVRLIGVILAAVALIGCGGSAFETSQTNNRDFHVEELFTHKGCTVYRFMDGGYRRYYTVCADGSASTEWREGSKSSRPQGITTARP